jgi:hypothetical protein
MGRLRSRLFSPIEAQSDAAGRPIYERFAIPYSFKPSLSVGEAVVAAAAAFFRIFFSSLLFAFWGAYSLAAVLRIRHWFWRVIAAALLIAIFLALLTLLLLAISAVARRLRLGRQNHTQNPHSL